MSESNGHADGQLGQIVSWRVPQTIPLPTLRVALSHAGLPQDLAPDMAPRNALLRGLREMKQGRVIRAFPYSGGDVRRFQFTKEYFGDREISYNKEAELALNVETGKVTSTVPELAVEAQQLLNEHLDKRLTTDLTRLVQRVFDSKRGDLIPIREQGGAYFVPDMHKDIVDQSRLLLDAIGGKMRSFAVRLGSADTSASVADSMFEYLKDMIEELESSCEEVNSDSRPAAVEARVNRFKEVRQKLSCYSGLMGLYSTSIEEKIAAAEKKLLANIYKPAVEEPLLA